MFNFLKSLYVSVPWKYFRVLCFGWLGLASQDHHWNQTFSFQLFGLAPASFAVWSLQCFLVLNALAGAYDLLAYRRRAGMSPTKEDVDVQSECPITQATTQMEG
jgi:hypothetical protein